MLTATIAPEQLTFLCNLVRERSAISLDSSKTYLLQSRLEPVARKNGFDSIVGLVESVRHSLNRQLIQEVVEAMTTNETSFFRDIHPFEALKNQIIPELIERRRDTRRINIWSNACSSGQEPYSILMLLRENFPELAGWNVNLLATDLCTTVLQKAREGLFNQTESNRGIPMPLLIKYFRREGINWRVNEDLRKAIDFRFLNLVDPFPIMNAMDVVFLRNVLIYFEPETKSQILHKVRRVIHKEGFLFLGGAETTIGLNVGFARSTIGQAAVYRPT